MAKENITKRGGITSKERRLKETQIGLSQKLHADLESDLIRLFRDSKYWDVQLTVDSTPILAHSCILQTRASRFYTLLITEFEVVKKDGFSSIIIYNASFSYIRQFVENIYTEIHTSEIEDRVLQYLQTIKNPAPREELPVNKPTEFFVKKIASTPESELFFTPKCSPSEFQKPFIQTNSFKNKENDVTSYYKIVSVDEIDIKLESDLLKSKAEDSKLLEKELEEQDELFQSFVSIIAKKSKSKPNSLPLSNVASSPLAKKATNKTCSDKFEPTLFWNEDFNKSKARLPLWKPNPAKGVFQDFGKHRNVSVKQKKKYSFYNYTEIEEKFENSSEEITNSCYSPDMDVSAAGGDSGLENSSSFQPEASPRDNTVSETSGVDLTEAAINEDIPHDEETVSTKPSSGSSSEVGDDETKTKAPPVNGGEGISNLNDEEMARLDAMEKNMKDCETFLEMERRACGCVESRDPFDSDDVVNHSNAVPLVIHDIILENNLNFSDDFISEEKTKTVIDSSNVNQISKESICDESENYGSMEGTLDDDTMCKNLKNNDIDFNYVLLEHDDSLKSNTSDFNSLKYEETNVATPPCSPKNEVVENGKTVDLVFPETKSSYWDPNPSSGNFFIDASSLLDEDEIISPPISLVNFKSIENGFDSKPEDVSFESEAACPLDLQDKERRQGDLIFKNSIPHFSRHEVEDKTERLRGGADEMPDEQVVPSAESELSVPRRALGEQEVQSPDSLNADVNIEDILRKSLMPKSSLAIDSLEPICTKKVDAESLPIVSGGVQPEDFSNPPSYSSSPHLRRRNEFAPILSGGMEFIEEKKTLEKKSVQNPGEAWIVDFVDNKAKRRNYITASSESDAELDDKSLPLHKKVRELKQVKKQEAFFIDISSGAKKEEEKTASAKSAHPIEKSASLGYFIDFGKPKESEKPERSKIPEKEPKQKKNMFSMFIDMSNESSKDEASSSENTVVAEDAGKKSFYMFIESESPVVRRKSSQKLLQRGSCSQTPQSPNLNTGTFRRSHKRTQSFSVYHSSAESRMKIKGSSQSLFDPDLSSADSSLPYIETQTKSCYAKLPLNKSQSLAAVNSDSKVTVWSDSSKDESVVSGESWLKTKDVQVTYTAKMEEISETKTNEDLILKKDSTFIIEEGKRKHKENGFYLGTVEESCTPKSPFKSPKPEERDSGVIATEESDDSFVKLSDMDNYKNSKKPNRMAQSIPESSWIENKNLTRTPENVMSRSIGGGIAKSASSFSADQNVSRSLSRLFPNLSMSASFVRKSNTSVSNGGKQDTDPSDTQVSEISELSSMQSSVEPSALEISTSETDVSSHAGHASRLGEDLLRMFLEEISPDVVVEVGGRRMKAHKCILSSRCQYFAAMLSGGWVESAGNVISLQGFSYNAVHFALCHIYSGENRIPDTLNIIELATLADMLCLEGLKEVISHTLKVKYCHCFHVPCAGCSVGILDCLPVAAAYGLDDLYRKCLRWITKYFVKLWPTKTFASLPKELVDKCYQHYVVHMTVENVLDTILNIDKVRGSLPSVRWAETVSKLVTKLHDAAVKYIADHFSSILTSDSFLALGKEAGWSVSRIEDSLMEATDRLPPEQACWSHARLHRILSVATSPDPPPEMCWSENFVELLQCIAGHVENSLIKQAPRAARSKAWRQMEPELRNRIQEAACLILPDEVRSPTNRRSASYKKENGQAKLSSTAARTGSRNLDLRQVKLAMTQQVNRNGSLGRPQPIQTDYRLQKESRLNSLKPTIPASITRKAESASQIRRAPSKSHVPNDGNAEPKKSAPARFSDVKSRYLEQKSPHKTAPEKSAVSNVRRTAKPLSSSDSSRNCSPAMRRSNLKAPISPSKKANSAGSNRQHRDSVLSVDSTTTCDSRKERSCVSTRSETPSVKTLSRLAADENMSTDSLCTDSLYSEKDATTKRVEDSSQKSKGKENVEERRKLLTRSVGSSLIPPRSKSSNNSPITKRTFSETTVGSSFKATPNKKTIITVTKSASDSKVVPPRRITAGRLGNANQSKAIPAKSSLASPRTSTSRNVLQRNSTKCDSNVINGNTVRKKNDVDFQNNKKNLKDDKRPTIVSRSGTFLKDEPTILKKPQIEHVQDQF